MSSAVVSPVARLGPGLASRPGRRVSRAAKRHRLRASASVVVRQVAGEGDELVRKLKTCASVTAASFGPGRSDAVSVLDGLVRKIKYSGEAFVLLEAVEEDEEGGGDGACLGCADVTALPAFGPRASKEALVARVPMALGLTEQSNFAYVSGMCVDPGHRRRGVGVKLLEACESYARRMTPTPAVIALHVDGDNEAAIALYEGCGYVRVVEREVDDAFGRMSRAFGSLVGGGAKKLLMHKWIKA